MLQGAPNMIPSSTEYERSITALATLQKTQETASGPMARRQNRIGLAAIAAAMDVPVVLATFRDENYVKTVTTHGLDLMNNLACFAAVCDKLCGERVVVIPDTRIDPAMAQLARHWPSDEICFLVGIPLRDSDGRRVGSLCVMNSSRVVARSGISFQKLSDVGKAFALTGQLQPLSANA